MDFNTLLLGGLVGGVVFFVYLAIRWKKARKKNKKLGV